MKKFLSFIIAVMFGLALNAQTSKPVAADFTSFDSYGNEFHLFDILEGGQYVLLHLTIEGGEDTPIVTPPMVEAYKALGCNQHDVFFIGVNANGTANSTQEFIEEYGTCAVYYYSRISAPRGFGQYPNEGDHRQYRAEE